MASLSCNQSWTMQTWQIRRLRCGAVRCGACAMCVCVCGAVRVRCGAMCGAVTPRDTQITTVRVQSLIGVRCLLSE